MTLTKTAAYSGHPQVIRTLDGADVEIDLELVELIDALWSAGYRTTNCCQGSPPTPRTEQSGGWQNPGYVSLIMDDGIRLLEKVGARKLSRCCSTIDFYGKDWRPQDPEEVLVLRFSHARLGEFRSLLLENL